MNDSNQSFVKFEKIDKSYDGEVLVVKNLNLDIAKGEFVTMLGPSGSGKTTTLMMLAGFETPTNGEIFLDTKPISKIPPYEREIGMVFQNYALFPHMTVSENLSFPLEVRKISKADTKDKVQKALDMVELGMFGSRFPAVGLVQISRPRAIVSLGSGALVSLTRRARILVVRFASPASPAPWRQMAAHFQQLQRRA